MPLPRVRFTVRRMMIAVAIVGASIVAVTLSSRKPFEMSLKPLGNGTMVRFVQPDKGLVSPDFPIALAIDAPRMIELRAGTVEIPGGKIEFEDTTLLPGRFRIRMGGTVFDVMERSIVVNGKPKSA